MLPLVLQICDIVFRIFGYLFLSSFSSYFTGMATYNQLFVFWSSWIQFLIQHDIFVSFVNKCITTTVMANFFFLQICCLETFKCLILIRNKFE